MMRKYEFDSPFYKTIQNAENAGLRGIGSSDSLIPPQAKDMKCR